MVKGINEEQARSVVSAYIVDEDRVALDGPLPLDRLISAAVDHLRGHIKQLAALQPAD